MPLPTAHLPAPLPAASRLGDACRALPWVALALTVGTALALLLAAMMEAGCGMVRPFQDTLPVTRDETSNNARMHAHPATHARS